MKLSFTNAQKVLTSSLDNVQGQGNTQAQLTKTQLEAISAAINNIPTNEKQFKKIFDEYSDPVSYKQKYMDSNAFLVYYTNGFDGPNRDSIEKDIPKQTLQYGARNDVWNGFEELMDEMKFADASSSIRDVLLPLNKVIHSLDEYLSYAPKGDIQKAELQINEIIYK